MGAVLNSAGVTLREELVLDISPAGAGQAGAIDAPAVIVLAGLTRRCESPHVVREALADCVAGRASVVAVLQHYDAGHFPASASWMGGQRYEKLPDSFEACAQLFEQVARGSGSACRLVLGRQWFTQVRPHACTGAAPVVPNVDRATIQTVALGRAYEWAVALAPGARAYVRARLDMAFCAPDLRGGVALPRRTLVADSEADLVTGGRFVYDLGAIMSADAAAQYFAAWRVWLPLNCSNTCYAGAGDVDADAVKPTLAVLCSGEVPLSKWLGQAALAPSHRMQRGVVIKADAGKSLRTVSLLFRKQRMRVCRPGFPRGLSPPRGAKLWACVRPGARGCKQWRKNRCYMMSAAVKRGVVWLPPATPEDAGPRDGRTRRVCRSASSSTVCSLHNVQARSARLAGRTVPWLALARASTAKACMASGWNASRVALFLRSKGLSSSEGESAREDTVLAEAADEDEGEDGTGEADAG